MQQIILVDLVVCEKKLLAVFFALHNAISDIHVSAASNVIENGYH